MLSSSYNIGELSIDLMAGIPNDERWYHCAFLLDVVDTIRMSSDTEGDVRYKTTTVYTSTGEVFVIDTPYKKFLEIWKEFINDNEETCGPNDLEL
jgi:hypothetical protein